MFFFLFIRQAITSFIYFTSHTHLITIPSYPLSYFCPPILSALLAFDFDAKKDVCFKTHILFSFQIPLYVPMSRLTLLLIPHDPYLLTPTYITFIRISLRFIRRSFRLSFFTQPTSPFPSVLPPPPLSALSSPVRVSLSYLPLLAGL